MKLKSRAHIWSAALAAAVLISSTGCPTTLITNITTDKFGNVELVFVNTTPFRAAFSFGTYDSLDRDPPGPAVLQQQRLAAGASTAPIAVTCNRNAAVGTAEFVARVLNLDLDKSTANFDPDAFDTTVHFSDAPAGSPLAGSPTAGTAGGSDKLLGVDYTCGDRLIFTFVEDPDAPGGFRTDFEVIQD